MEYYLAIAQLMTGAKMQRKNVSSGTQWELVLGYSRVVRLGDSVYVSGTTATDKEDNIVGVANPYAQTIQVIKNIQTALQAVGASLKDVVRTRVYVTDMNNWKKVGQAHAEFFKHIRPASTLVEVSRLINRDPDGNGGRCHSQHSTG